MMFTNFSGMARAAFWSAVLPLIVLFNGCAIGPPARDAVISYDLGPQAVTATAGSASRVTLMVPEASAPAWLDSTGIVYRLTYLDSARPQVYAQSRWVDSPSALLTQRMRTRFAAVGPVVNGRDGARADYALLVEIEDFSQIFENPDSSKVSIRLRVSLVNLASRGLIAQRTFSLNESAGADAKGAVRAFAHGTDNILENIVDWARSNLKSV